MLSIYDNHPVSDNHRDVGGVRFSLSVLVANRRNGPNEIDLFRVRGRTFTLITIVKWDVPFEKPVTVWANRMKSRPKHLWKPSAINNSATQCFKNGWFEG